MSCFSCAQKYGFFRKEYSCKSCGKSFCSDCVKWRACIPRLNNVEHSVCQTCHGHLTRPASQAGISHHRNEFGPSMKDIVADTTQSSGGARAGFAKNDASGSKSTGRRDPDAAIRERLDNLKTRAEVSGSSSTGDHTDEDVAKRFADITGRTPQVAKNSRDILTPQVKLTEVEQIEQLLKQTKEEVQIDDRYNSPEDDETVTDKVEDMERRLRALKGEHPGAPSKQEPIPDAPDDTEYDSVMRTVKQAIAEARLDESMKRAGYGDEFDERNDQVEKPSTSINLPPVPRNAPSNPGAPLKQPEHDDEELPWCCICNSDAVLRCHDCDDDLYCKRCFKEGHDEYELKHHQVEPYKTRHK